MNVRGYACDMVSNISPYICRNREGLAKVAVDEGYDYLMFFDNDMVFPESIIEEFMGHMERGGVGVVTTNYVTKEIPARYMCVGDGGEVKTGLESTGLEAVMYAPTGTMLIDVELLKRVRRPWFFVAPKRSEGGELAEFLAAEYGWRHEHGGEDYWFCNQVRQMGEKVWCDHDMSKRVSHVGDYTYTFVDGMRKDNYTANAYALAGGGVEKREG